jgi:hypothetical protein
MKHLRLVILLIFVLVACQQAPAETLESNATRQARNANSFVESIGVNTHVNYYDTAYGNYDDLLKPSLLYLGVRHIRDGLTDDALVLQRYRNLYSYGIKVTGGAPYQTDSMPALITMIKMQRDVLAAVEGPNETDIFTQFSYKGQGFPKGTIAFMKDFYPAIKNDPLLRSLPVLQTTLAFPGYEMGNRVRADLLGDLSSYADYGNSHNYFAFGEVPSGAIKNHHLPLNSRITPGKPMMSSEGGYQMGDGDGYKGNWDDGQSAPFSESVHGRYLLRYLLEQYRLGYKRSFIYELLDIDQPQWGLFRNDGTPRPAAKGIRSMIQLLHEGYWDTTAKRWVVPGFTPGTLDYTLSAVPSSVHSLLFQKSNGTFYLVLWNELKNWNAVTGKPVFHPSISAMLKLSQPVNLVRTFLPLFKGTQPVTTSSSSTLRLSIADHPLIVEITLR